LCTKVAPKRDLVVGANLVIKETTNSDVDMSHRSDWTDPVWHTLAEFSLPSVPGNEKTAMAEVANLIQPLNLPETLLERVKTAVAESTMNAMEHGNHYQADLPVQISVYYTAEKLRVRIIDQGPGPDYESPELPDLEAKLEGLQSPRGWGLFLIQHMVDELQVSGAAGINQLDLIFNLGEKRH
jgi:anti-sigma regulatory factor (Ser/Thr protein kinase)